ncbi:MAG: hypothetical protein HYZ47_04865 [Simkania negevensis]|nr:hypothetical protein [Simkania negevensis]
MVQITFPANNLKSAYAEEPPTPPNPLTWEKFYQSFTDKEKEKFSSTLMHQISLSIQKDLKKMKESLRKLRESNR